jgi:hypothetical protein
MKLKGKVKKMYRKSNSELVIGIEYKGVAGHALITAWGDHIKWEELTVKPILVHE